MITGAAAAGGLLIGIGTGPGRRRRRVLAATVADSPDALVNLWVKISPDNLVTVLVDKLEMGQGTHTGLAMLLAEELGADWSTVSVEHVPVIPEFATGQMIEMIRADLGKLGVEMDVYFSEKSLYGTGRIEAALNGCLTMIRSSI